MRLGDTSSQDLIDLLGLVAGDASLPELLEAICRTIERARPGCRASILLLDADRLRHGAAPSLDADYCAAVDGLLIGPDVGSCGTAAATRRTTIAADIATDPRWTAFAALAAAHGLAACWSEPIVGPDGTVLGTFGIYRDVPGPPTEADLDLLRRAAHLGGIVLEREQRHRELDEARNWLDLALEAARAGLWDWDVPSGTINASAGYRTMLGLEPDDRPLDMAWFVDTLHPEDRERILDESAVQTAGPDGRFDLRFRLRAADGTYRWIQSVGRVLHRDATGAPLRVIGQHVDVTERVAIERREREASERLARISATAPVMLYQFRIDARGEVALPYVSDRVSDFYGCTPEDARADPSRLFGRAHRDDVEGVWTSIRRSHARMEDWRHEFRVEGPDGSWRWLHGHAVPRREADGSVVWHGALADVTDRKALEERLIEAGEAATAASRAKGAFITNLSHELRTPLTAILGFLDLIEQGVLDRDAVERAEAFVTIRRNGTTLLRLIDDMLDLARIEQRRLRLEPVEVDPRRVVEEALDAERERADAKGLRLEVLHETPVPEYVRTDPARLRQVIGHLLDNAVKFTDVGGVTVRLAVVDDAAPGPAPDDAGDGPRLRITVEDTGIGMSESQIERAFEAFSQADSSLTRAHGGAGLGLRIASALARMLGGDLRVRSRPGEGTAFVLSIRLESPIAAAARGEPVAAPHRSPRPWRMAEEPAALEAIAAMDAVCPADFGVEDASLPGGTADPRPGSEAGEADTGSGGGGADRGAADSLRRAG